MSTPKIVVVTGAAGFLGSEVTKQLLEKGYTVRATVRKADPVKIGNLYKLGEALPGTLEVVEADLNVDGSFDKATDGAAYVFHTASPAEFGSGNPEEDEKNIVAPAVKGTKTVIQSASKSKALERVVLTSSVVALHDIPASNSKPKDGKAFGTEDYNEDSTLANNPYAYSKVEAEKAAWKLAKELNVDLVTILSSFIVGPVLTTRGGFSVDSIKSLVEGKDFDTLFVKYNIDVRDVAKAHIIAAEKNSAHGRYILSHTHSTNYKDAATALAAEFPQIAFGKAKDEKPELLYDNKKVLEELGLDLIPQTQSFVDGVRTVLALGYGKPALKN